MEEQMMHAIVYLLMLFSPQGGSITQVGYYKDVDTCEKYSKLFVSTFATKGVTVRGICIPHAEYELPTSANLKVSR